MEKRESTERGHKTAGHFGARQKNAYCMCTYVHIHTVYEFQADPLPICTLRTIVHLDKWAAQSGCCSPLCLLNWAAAPTFIVHLDTWASQSGCCSPLCLLNWDATKWVLTSTLSTKVGCGAHFPWKVLPGCFTISK